MKYWFSKGTEEIHLDGKYWVGDPVWFFPAEIMAHIFNTISGIEPIVIHYREFDIPIFNTLPGYYSISKEDGVILDVVGKAQVGLLMALIPSLLFERAPYKVSEKLLKLKGVPVYDQYTVSIGEYYLSPAEEYD